MGAGRDALLGVIFGTYYRRFSPSNRHCLQDQNAVIMGGDPARCHLLDSKHCVSISIMGASEYMGSHITFRPHSYIFG